MRRAAPAFIVLSAAALFSCLPPRPTVAPPPPTVESVEGYATFRLTRDDETAKSRISFILRLPDQGRIEVIDPLGRSVSLLFIEGAQAHLLLPGRRAYWTSGREEVMSRLLGFAAELADLVHILAGREDRLTGWALEKDAQGRVVRGRRDDLEFETRLFFEKSPVPQLLILSRNHDRGSLRVLRLNFNQPLKENAFDLFFLKEKGYRAVGWDEVEKWL